MSQPSNADEVLFSVVNRETNVEVVLPLQRITDAEKNKNNQPTILMQELR